MKSQLISDEEKGGEVVMMMQQVDGQDEDPPSKMRLYKECLKNHAASIGGNAVDGCGEFLPGDSLSCSACGCHRNFHRKELFDPIITTSTPAPMPIMHARSTSDNSGDADAMASRAVEDDYKLKKKKRRYRTKFSKEQREKLAKFAERAGWKMQRLEGGVVEEFCREIGIQRKVLKVWMHNNKHNYTTSLPHF